MKATGNTRKIIEMVGEIQSLIGNAKSNVMNDRDSFAIDRAMPALEKAFSLCIEITGMYDPIDSGLTKRAPDVGQAGQ